MRSSPTEEHKHTERSLPCIHLLEDSPPLQKLYRKAFENLGVTRFHVHPNPAAFLAFIHHDYRALKNAVAIISDFEMGDQKGNQGVEWIREQEEALEIPQDQQLTFIGISDTDSNLPKFIGATATIPKRDLQGGAESWERQLLPFRVLERYFEKEVSRPSTPPTENITTMQRGNVTSFNGTIEVINPLATDDPTERDDNCSNKNIDAGNPLLPEKKHPNSLVLCIQSCIRYLFSCERDAKIHI